MVDYALLAQNLLGDLVNALGQLIIVFVILSISVFAGRVVQKIVAEALRRVKLDEWVAKNNLQKPLGSIMLSDLGGAISKWYIILVGVIASTDFLNIQVLSQILTFLATYIPLGIIAVVIFVIGVLFARLVRNKVSKSELSFATKAGQVIEFIIIYIALIIALDNLRLDVSILEVAFVEAFKAFAWAIAIVVAVLFGISIYPIIKRDADTLMADIKKMGQK